MIEIRYLKHIVALSQFKNFRKAAEAVNISQPALTKSIQKVETLLGVKLFERNSDKVKTTKYGNFVVNNAQSIISGVEDIKSGVDTLKSGLEGTLRIGYHPFYSCFIADALKDVLKPDSSITFDFHLLGHREAVNKVIQKDIDFYLGIISNEFANQHTELRFKTFPVSDIVYVVSSKHPLAQKKKVLDVDTLKCDWVALDNRSTVVYKKWLMEALSLDSYDKIEKRVKVFVPDYTIMKKLLVDSNYMAIMPKALISEEIQKGVLTEIKPEWKIPHIKIQGFLMYLENYTLPPHLDLFMSGLTRNMLL